MRFYFIIFDGEYVTPPGGGGLEFVANKLQLKHKPMIHDIHVHSQWLRWQCINYSQGQSAQGPALFIRRLAFTRIFVHWSTCMLSAVGLVVVSGHAVDTIHSKG